MLPTVDPLLAAFYQHAPAARSEDPGALEAALRELAAAGAAAWPDLHVPPEVLVARAARASGSRASGSAAKSIAALRGADLILACACELSLAGAVEALDRTVLRSRALSAALARIDASDAFIDEARQALREKLLVRKDGAPPRIAEYSGLGSLSHWTCAVGMRLALNLRRGKGPPASSEDEAFAVAAADTSPELRALKDRAGRVFKEALAEAVASLEDEQVNLLKLQHVDGLRTSEIASLFRVDRSTIKRRLAACRARLGEEAQRRLRERLKLSPAELESLAGLVQSELQQSLARILKRG
jgi:RNA polymerase sigma-70 factor (ECF subfamily)